MTLSEQTARRLEAAGITADDPRLEQIRQWNRDARIRAELAAAGYRRRPFGYKI